MPEFKISIPKPCSQDWNGMAKLNGGGRHCGQCKTTVFDFSQMTDQELLNFFNINSAVHCGRFHNTQLDRQIIPLPKTDRFLSRINKLAAAAVAVLSFSNLPATPAKTNIEKATYLAGDEKGKNAPPDKIIISGTVTGDDGKLLANAKVALDSVITFTDNDGRFSFELDRETAAPHNLYFSFDGLLPVVRTYHPSMLSTTYEVGLSAPHPERYYGGGTMGVMVSFDDSFVFPSIKFKKGTALAKCDLKTLTSFATDLKANPWGTVAIIGQAESEAQRKIIQKRIKTIIDYLVDKQGLSPERFKQHIYNSPYSDAIGMKAYEFDF
jgi:hypothetical protein